MKEEEEEDLHREVGEEPPSVGPRVWSEEGACDGESGGGGQTTFIRVLNQ